MKKIVITGGRGFLGRNLAARLAVRRDCEVAVIDQQESVEALNKAIAEAEVIFHLAGVNRPNDPSEFQKVNTGLTEQICAVLRGLGRTPKIVFSSSTQAELDNPYGSSKKQAEEALVIWSRETAARIRIYRLRNLFGKWCRPNYNSVTATFCHNIAHHLPITISDTAQTIDLTYVDDVVSAFIREIDEDSEGFEAGASLPSYTISLGELASRIHTFSEMSETLTLPDFSDWFNRALYATYLSYVPARALERGLTVKADERGSLAEFIKYAGIGQIFLSRTKPGVTRGNHYHHTKTEKFFVVEGEGLIRMRHIESDVVEEYRVSGKSYQVVDIPPGVTHSITNVGTGELVTIFWSDEIFNPDLPDTYYLAVDADTLAEQRQAVNA